MTQLCNDIVCILVRYCTLTDLMKLLDNRNLILQLFRKGGDAERGQGYIIDELEPNWDLYNEPIINTQEEYIPTLYKWLSKEKSNKLKNDLSDMIDIRANEEEIENDRNNLPGFTD